MYKTSERVKTHNNALFALFFLRLSVRSLSSLSLPHRRPLLLKANTVTYTVFINDLAFVN